MSLRVRAPRHPRVFSSLGRRLASAASLAASVLASCGSPQRPPAAERNLVMLSIVGTNDLHGHLRALPWLAGYVDALRAARAAERGGHGGVVLIDGGDMFQGTLESNLAEGAPVVEAYGLVGYDAVTIGNHEFDYGPEGEAATPRDPSDDPRGALLARARDARFAVLAANLRRAADGEPIAWDHVAPSALLERAGVRVGVIGVTTEDTLSTTLAANVRDLAMEPLARAIAREAAALRARGAQVVIVAAHAGGQCEFAPEGSAAPQGSASPQEHPPRQVAHDPDDLSRCDADEEIFAVAEALPEGSVDVIVAGHTHAGVAHRVHGIPIIESYSYGRAFGRVDLEVDPQRGVVRSTVFAPRSLCETGSFESGDCEAGAYEGRPVGPSAEVARAIEPALARAETRRIERLGVRLEGAVTRAHATESALGNLFTDLMRAARGDADVALTNGGGLRADLPAGELTYGALYEAMPFDNRFARVRLSAAELAEVIAENLRRSGGFFSLSGLRVEARCEAGALRVELFDERGPVAADRMLTLLTTDFLATGGDGALGRLSADRVSLEDAEPVREAMARVLRGRSGSLRADELLDASRPRVRYPGSRPVRCAN
jgi:5'-nucleotidase